MNIKFLNKTLNILVQDVANKALQVTKIVSEPNPPSVNALGNGIFLKINDDRYLISAGHLLNLKDWPNLMIPGDSDKMVYLRGRIITTYDTPNSNHQIDGGLVKISKSQNKYFTDKIFACNPHNIIVNHLVDEDGHYVIAGYPVSGVKKVSGSLEFRPIPVKFLTFPIKSDKYNAYGFNPNHFILVKYQRKVAALTSDIREITKELRGISGSGLWYIPNWNDRKNGTPNFYLVGIMVENYKDKGFLSALRIDFATEIINQLYSSSVFEHSNYTYNGEIGDLYIAENQ